MVSRLNPYLSFSGNAREALEFYRDVFGGELRLSTFGQYGTDDPNYTDKIMHGILQTPSGYTLMASDTGPGMTVTAGTNVVCSISGDDADELHQYWDRLSSSGMISVPMDKQMWGDEFGSCVDRFGVEWMVNIAQPQSGTMH
ncbi:MAG TPA: VOC family protein [Micromonosporaceae bacterium]|jgi:PhnB protein